MRRLARTLVILFSLAAWFALSNHCALGSSTESTAAMSGCAMHSSPPKKKPAAKIPCCKDVRATVAKTVIAQALAPRLNGWHEYALQIFPAPARAALEIDGADTGPPGCFSFAESVLQESLLSHAPPVS